MFRRQSLTPGVGSSAPILPSKPEAAWAVTTSLSSSISRVVRAERATLFIVDHRHRLLYSWVAKGLNEEECIKISMDTGLAGYVARTGKLLSIDDPYNDPRFNKKVDLETGYTTRNVLCVPVVDSNGRICAVLQLVNKLGAEGGDADDPPGGFDAADAEILRTFAPVITVQLQSVPTDELPTLADGADKQRGVIHKAAARRASISRGRSTSSARIGPEGSARTSGGSVAPGAAVDAGGTPAAVDFELPDRTDKLRLLALELAEGVKSGHVEVRAAEPPNANHGGGVLASLARLPGAAPLRRCLAVDGPRDAFSERVESVDYEAPVTYAARKILRNAEELAAARREKMLFPLLLVTVGVLVGIATFVVHVLSIELLAAKFELVELAMSAGGLAAGGCTFVAAGTVFALVSALLVELVAPSAAGSGMASVLLLLNGTHLPKGFRFATLVVKMAGLVLVAGSGLACGQEGPMIHMGAIIGNLVASAARPMLRRTSQLEGTGRHWIDLVGCGGGAALSGAFLAPIAGVMFVMEELGTFWSKSLLISVFTTCLVAASVGMILHAIEHADEEHPFRPFSERVYYISLLEADEGGKVRGVFLAEILVFGLMGCCGGLFGALFNRASSLVTGLRRTHASPARWRRLLDVIVLAAATAQLTWLVVTMWPCTDFDPDTAPELVAHYASSLGCADDDGAGGEHGGEHGGTRQWNELATLFLSPVLKTSGMLLSLEHKAFSLAACCVYGSVFVCLAVLTIGTTVPHGLLLVTITVGAAFGRAFGILAERAVGVPIVHGVYALVGASAFVSGCSHNTIAFMMILIELMNDSTYMIPCIFTAICARGIGVRLGRGFYENQVLATGHPFLHQEDEVHPELNLITAEDVMTHHPVCVHGTEPAGTLARTLASCAHNGFPIVDRGISGKDAFLIGFVTRSRLMTVLHEALEEHRADDDALPPSPPRGGAGSAVSAEAVLSSLQALGVSAELGDADALARTHVDLRHYSDICPHVLREVAPIKVVLQTFLRLGARHVTVVDEKERAVGIISRGDVTPTVLHGLLQGLSKETRESRITIDSYARLSTPGAAAPSGPEELELPSRVREDVAETPGETRAEDAHADGSVVPSAEPPTAGEPAA